MQYFIHNVLANVSADIPAVSRVTLSLQEYKRTDRLNVSPSLHKN